MNRQLEHQLRLYTGLIIAVFLVMHLLNAALGLISLPVMDQLGKILFGFWSTPIMLILLYGSFLIHSAMGLVALFRHRSWRMPVWNVLQIVLGLALPYLLIGHAFATRGTEFWLDVPRNYTEVIYQLWNNPEAVFRQFALVAIAWSHLCLGLHFWLRYKPFYSRWVLALYPLSLIIPLLAAIGFARAGLETRQISPEDITQLTLALDSVDPAKRAMVRAISDRSLEIFFGLVVAVIVLRGLRDFRFKQSGDFRVTHTTHEKILKGKKGQSVLEALRAARVPHAAICGGRGRCTTCRVRVNEADSALNATSELEATALQRVGAGPNVRLACQLRPTEDITITPLLQADIAAIDLQPAASVVGREQAIACMFVDMRGSTALGEKKMPYDVVFILNHFLVQLAEALRSTNGHYANFTGDGLMGLYGLHSDLDTGCKDALKGAAHIFRRLDKLNSWLAEELDEPLKIGIGIHCGVAIVGTMGPPDSPMTSALGDTINISARLEALTKTYGTSLIVSDDVLRNAGVAYQGLPMHNAEVKGRIEGVDVRLVDDIEQLLAHGQIESTQNDVIDPIGSLL